MSVKVLVLRYEDILPNAAGDDSSYYLRMSVKFTDLSNGHQETLLIDVFLEASDNLVTIENKIRDEIVIKIGEFGYTIDKTDIIMLQIK